MTKWTHWFPFPTFRAGQEETLCRIVAAFDQSPVVFLEGETGLGKSGIAVALAKHYGTAYISTVEKQLQDQYYRDFHQHLALLKGKNTYACGKHWGSDGVPIHYMADKAPCGLNAPSKKDISDQCAVDDICPYVKARQHALTANMTLMNFHNLLLFSSMKLQGFQRELAVFDEAHELPSTLYSFAEIPFTLRAFAPLKKLLTAVQLEKLEVGFSSISDVAGFCLSLQPLLKQRIALGALSPEEEMEIERLKAHDKKIVTLCAQITEGLPFVLKKAPEGGTIVSPRFVHHVAPMALKVAKRILIMSATIPDPASLAKQLGITNYQSIRVEGTFPPENRPIFVLPVGSMTYAQQETTFPKMISYTQGLLRKHAYEKGLIHTFNYNITKRLQRELGNNPRYLFQLSAEDKPYLVQQHLERKDPTVLIGPGFIKGIDLKYDLCRFMLMLKMPNADIKDPLVASLMEHDSDWYSLQTVIAIIQMLGRGFRAADDECVVYILDTFFKSIYDRKKEWFPQNIRKSVVYL